LKNAIDDNPVEWYTEQKAGEEPREIIGVRISGRDSTKLLGYVGGQAQDPTGYIPSINAKVTSLRFFENPPQGIPREQRVYSTRFLKSRVKRIFWELTLQHPAPGQRVNFLIESVWHSPTTEQGLRRSMRASLHQDWTWSYWHDGGRIIAKQSEPWPVGSYRVDLYVAGAKVTSGAFEIADDTSPVPNRSSASLRENEELAEAAYQEAQRLKSQLKAREAIAYLDKAIRLNPEFIPAYELRGTLYYILLFEAGKDSPRYTQLAIADFTTAIEKALKRGDRHPDLYRSRGELYWRQEEYQQALADFDEAIKLDPRDAATLGNRGELRQIIGDLDGSLADHTRAIELEKKGVRYCQRGLTWLLKGNAPEARDDFHRCSELDPSRREEYNGIIKRALEERKQKP
jgi:tetratricopeptide (TPR) repeat protein